MTKEEIHLVQTRVANGGVSPAELLNCVSSVVEHISANKAYGDWVGVESETLPSLMKAVAKGDVAKASSALADICRSLDEMDVKE